jgi:hypothetical protein
MFNFRVPNLALTDGVHQGRRIQALEPIRNNRSRDRQGRRTRAAICRASRSQHCHPRYAITDWRDAPARGNEARHQKHHPTREQVVGPEGARFAHEIVLRRVWRMSRELHL